MTPFIVNNMTLCLHILEKSRLFSAEIFYIDFVFLFFCAPQPSHRIFSLLWFSLRLFEAIPHLKNG